VNPSFKVNDRGLIYASYSSGFNAPALYELYAPDRNYISGIARGNRNLKPETSSSYEIGLKQYIGVFTFSADYFHTVISNLIEDVYLWDKNIGIDTLGNDYLRDDFRGDTYLNVGKQTTDGFEVTLETRIAERLSLTGNFSLIAGTLDYTSSDINLSQTESNHVQLYSNGAFVTGNVETKGLARRPNTANLGVLYRPVEPLALRIDVRYAGRRNDVFYDSKLGPYGALGSVPIAAYTLIDFSQRYSFDDHFILLGRIENILGTKYSEISGFTTRGRGAYISLRYEGQPF
jgi:vitamin B12 transporter